MTSFILAAIFYASVIWAAIFYFKVDNEDAKHGKNIISIISGLSTLYALYKLYGLSSEISIAVVISNSLFVLSTILFWWSYLAVRDRNFDFAFSSNQPKKIQTKGPYKFVRHPFYLSYILGWIPPVILIKDTPSIAILIVMSTIYIAAIRKEERIISQSSLSKIYSEYTSTTGMLLPKIRIR